MGEDSGGDKSSISNDLSMTKLSTLLVLFDSLMVLVRLCFFFPFVCFHAGGGGGGRCCGFFQKIHLIFERETQSLLIALIKFGLLSVCCSSTLPLHKCWC